MILAIFSATGKGYLTNINILLRYIVLHQRLLTKYPQGVYYKSMNTTDIKRRALHRIKIIQGQMRGLEKQIADDVYCMDILTQSLALQKSLASLNKLILERHLRTHIADKIASGDEIQQNEAVEELLNLYELNNIRTK